MKALLRSFAPGAGRGHSLGLALVLLVLVLVPSACLLWFMTQAARNERLAVRQQLIEAYRGHLALAQERLAAYWHQTADALDTQAETTPAAALFAKQVRAGLADAVVCFDSAGQAIYPSGSLPPDAGKTLGAPSHILELLPRDLELSGSTDAAAAYAHLAEQATNIEFCARALQAEARCLVQAGKKADAVKVLTGPLADERFERAIDAQGRLLVPNAELLALELLNAPADASVRDAVLQRLKRQVLDYDNSTMSAPQRRFLLRQLQALHPDAEVHLMLSAEDLAAQYLETVPNRVDEPGLRSTALPGVWQFASSRGRVVTLHRTESLVTGLRAGTASQNLPPDVSLSLLPPGKESETSLPSLLAGPLLPGWRLTLALKDQRLFDNAAEQRVTTYIWIGVLVVAAAAVLASLALGLVRRQMALTQLRNDLVANVTHELKTPLASMRLLVDTLLNTEKLHAPTVREYLQLIAQENLRLSRLIDNFLAFSRMERSKYAFDFKEVPAAAIVEAAAAAVRERFQGPECRFEARLAAELPPVVADAAALTTALVNLLDNAYKYSGDNKEIILAAEAFDGRVRFTVTDNGIGLSPRDTQRIFRRFYQVNQASARSSGGCGLGLSIVEFIVQAHRGSVSVQSRLGYGSTFTIDIPAVVFSAASEIPKR